MTRNDPKAHVIVKALKHSPVGWLVLCSCGWEGILNRLTPEWEYVAQRLAGGRS